MAIKYNPYNWEIRPRKKKIEPIIFDVDIDEEHIIKAIMDSLIVTLKDYED